MGSVTNLLQDWSADDGERFKIYTAKQGLALRWLNEAQLRFADKSEILRDVWTPDIPDDGYLDLPDDCLRIVKDSVIWDSNTVLTEIPHPRAIFDDLSETSYYSIWDGKFYVWKAAAGTPKIAYIKRPFTVTYASLSTASLEIPDEYQSDLHLYLEARLAMLKGNLPVYTSFMGMFDNAASVAGQRFGQRNAAVPMMRGGVL